MDHQPYDLVVIGAGSGGVRAGRLAAQAGFKVAVAEQFRPGGTCVIRGCIPKKYMAYAADFGRGFAAAEGFGWTADAVRYDHGQFQQAMQAEISRLSGLYEKNLKAAGAELVGERAEILGPHSVRLMGSGRTLETKRILVATGGRPWRPLDLLGQNLAITSDEVFELKALPKRVVIAGGGYIAVEFASIFSGLGVDTTLIYRGEAVLNGFDTDVRQHMMAALRRQGVQVLTEQTFTKIDGQPGEITAHTTKGEVLTCDTLMFAIGRVPNAEGLGLESAGVELDARGAVKVDPFSRTKVPSIWAVGDVTDRMNLTPVAIREAQAFVETEFLGRPNHFDHQDVATAVFSSPPVGVVGLSEAEARAQHGELRIFRTVFRPMKDRLTGKGEEVLMKLVVRVSDDRVLGCHIAGPDAPEIIQAVAIAIRMGATKADFDRTCAVHPTLAEELVLLRTPVA
jgi:glutathione reductase (NADPH)